MCIFQTSDVMHRSCEMTDRDREGAREGDLGINIYMYIHVYFVHLYNYTTHMYIVCIYRQTERVEQRNK